MENNGEHQMVLVTSATFQSGTVEFTGASPDRQQSVAASPSESQVRLQGGLVEPHGDTSNTVVCLQINQ